VSNLEQFPENYADDPTVAHILEQIRSDDPSPILVTGEQGNQLWLILSKYGVIFQILLY